MKITKKQIIIGIGITNIIIGAQVLIPSIRSYLFVLRRFSSSILIDYPSILHLITAIIMAIALIKIVAGYGLIRIKNWGRKFTTLSLLLDSIVRAVGFINFSITSYFYNQSKPLIPQISDTLNIISATDNTIPLVVHGIDRISIIPSLIILAFNLVVIILLNNKNFVTEFKK